MEIYLIRHGVADARGSDYPDDRARPLTKEGRAGLRREARGLADHGVSFDRILTSPLVRTRQTADVFAKVLKAPVAPLPALAPDGTAAAVLRALEKLTEAEPALADGRLALVGHEPNIGELAAHLLGTKQPVPFKKGAVCRLDVDAAPDAGTARLVWFLTPKQLRALGEV